MNSGKKVLKGETKPVKQININRTEPEVSGKAKIFIAIAAVLAVFMVAYIVWENHHTKYLVSIDGEKVTIDEMMYDVYEVEETYAYMASFYAQLGYGDYWTMELGENGETVQEIAREECMNSYIAGEVLYKEAIANGYEVTDEDRADAEAVLESIIDAYTTTDEETEETVVPTEVLGFTTDELRTILEEREVAARYKEELTSAYGITTADVADSVDKEAFRQYDIEYFEISLDGTETDEEGNLLEITEEEKEARYEAIKAVLEEAGSKEWSTVISKEDTDSESEEIKVEYDTDNFILDESYFDDASTEMIMAMENGEVSEIFESDGYYYVVKMINNNSTERYETELEDAVTAKEEEKFQEAFEAMKEKYNVKIYEGDWKKVAIGSLTV